MKIEELQNIVKKAVKEAFQEEMKEILLEAVKSSNKNIVESVQQSPPLSSQLSPLKARESYMNILEEMNLGPKTGLEGEFKLSQNIDPINGSLPDGQLSLDSISKLLGGK